MHRRDALRILAGTAALPILPHDLLAQGHGLRARQGSPSRVLDAHQRQTVAAIADLIIPDTDTPGARAAGVPDFIDLMLAEWYDAGDKDRFLAGLADVDARTRRSWGKPFVECSAEQQTQLLTTLDHEVTAARETGAARGGPPFFHMTKRLTLIGYYTSQIGATRELHYQVIPGLLDGCAPYPPGAG